MQTHADVIVIGCGPAGSTAATYLAKAGRRVVALEKEVFPRFHIGESLLPYNQSLFEEMGVWPALAAAGFPRKVGAQFHLAHGSKSRRFVFRQGVYTRQTEAIQVERATFDHLLMQHARTCGAQVDEGWTVTGVQAEATGVRVHAVDAAGNRRVLNAPFVLDASGRGNLTGNQAGLRIDHPRHRKVASFAHFTGVKLDDGEARGDTVIVRAADLWFWIIPITEAKTSVGLVVDATALSAQSGGAEVLFEAAVKASPVMEARLAGATRVGRVHVTGDFSYRNRRLVDARVLRIGDAAGFMDPIFSSGVYLAMWSGKLAAQAIQQGFESEPRRVRAFAAYERRVQAAFRLYWRLIEGFYTTPFLELFLEPRSRWNLPAAMVALLAGELEGGWRLKWRIELFYLLVRLQPWLRLVPGIDFTPLVADRDPTTAVVDKAGTRQ